MSNPFHDGSRDSDMWYESLEDSGIYEELKEAEKLEKYHKKHPVDPSFVDDSYHRFFGLIDDPEEYDEV
jgi:hypothetical protein